LRSYVCTQLNFSLSDSIGVEVGGYDLSDLLQADPENPQQSAQTKQTMEDIIRVGVNHITASLDSELFVVKGDKDGESGNDRAAAEKVARKIQSTAAEMAGSVGGREGETFKYITELRMCLKMHTNAS